MGPIRLSISDIEFVQGDEIVLDEADVILIEDRAPRATVHRASHALPLRPFDDAVTRVWSRAAQLRACR